MAKDLSNKFIKQLINGQRNDYQVVATLNVDTAQVSIFDPKLPPNKQHYEINITNLAAAIAISEGARLYYNSTDGRVYLQYYDTVTAAWVNTGDVWTKS